MTQLQLHIQHIKDICHFRLVWGNNQQLTAQLPYPIDLFQQYKTWQTAYLNYYRQAQRGRPGPIVSVAGMDGRSGLQSTEASFLQSFQTWLNQEPLLRIRAEIAKASQTTAPADLLITCEPLDLDRLPWETWNLTAEFPHALRITRIPANIAQPTRLPKKRPKLRILAILGDESGLDFQQEKRTLEALRHLAEVRFVGYQPNQDNSQLRTQIRTALVDAVGWDILFFAGHSNEQPDLGGELGIAPGARLSIQEIADDLQTAKENGLQLAFFNSCKGLDIANSLINLGFSQVVIMREPVHNAVAQQLFAHFIHHFIQRHQAFHPSLIAACADLKAASDYPSSHWISSLFRHPGATLPQLPLTFKERLKRQWLPTRWEAGVIASLACLSLLNPLQAALLDRRIWVQAIYREVTGQLPTPTTPPVRIISIDAESLKRAQIRNTNPLPWAYLAQILDRLAPYNPKIIGIDYVLDQPKDQTQQSISAIGKSVKSLVQTQKTWIALASDNGVSAHPATGIKPFDWTLQGQTHSSDWFLPLPSQTQPCEQTCSLAYLLALSGRLQPAPQRPQPLLQPPLPFQTQIIAAAAQLPDSVRFRQRSTTQPITDFSRHLRQYWLQPLYDFSIPPRAVYEITAAHDLLEEPSRLQNVIHLRSQIILIAAGGYKESGLNEQHQDYGPPPAAMAFWTPIDQPASTLWTGGQLNAYAIHHVLNQHFVIPIPDLWMVLIAGIVGKYLTHLRFRKKGLILILLAPVYTAAAIYIYVAGDLLIPIVFPLVAIALYLPPLSRSK
jgi:CHASE2 domain/CHAT domain